MIVTDIIELNLERLEGFLSPCKLCPRECGADRVNGQVGFCGAPDKVKISSTGAHFGEEPPITGIAGSGTIFFSYCTLSCKFCQNYPISQLHNGKYITIAELSDIMLKLQKDGCHNVNLVTPTHYTPQIARAIINAKSRGLEIPIVYNTSGYERVEVLECLEGLIDVYLPDAKYSDDKHAVECSNVSGYVEHNRKALLEMWRQVGEFEEDDNGFAKKGLIVRHLVLPHNKSGTEETLNWIAQNIPDARVSLMSQYFPAHNALLEPELNCTIDKNEYELYQTLLERNELSGWSQPL
ncbi:MAG TPA: radical SAM protein [Caldisericia bacterium]|nr:radical SAM protein [Caldisericia bacterium]HPF49127.1 radical SAM protein [Caldisericia bacterium]HPI83009.1 radical SAM protein [Caldisericia bacterium]HPQ92236.1 radical SAM protein [Caldisericia bacterium]HRV74666.1 radical SAM protein [Caldisericia bacterium]